MRSALGRSAEGSWPVDCSVEVDAVDESGWYALLRQFSDANVYQTWAYERARSANNMTSHLVVRRGDVVVAAAQARIVKMPLAPVGVAYVRWGPLWQRWDSEARPEDFALALRALREEYVGRRGLLLRVLPYAFEESSIPLVPTLNDLSFERVTSEVAQQTLVMDIDRPVPEIRKNLDQKWRNCLNQSEKNSIEVEDSFDTDAFEVFAGIYAQMYSRKRFAAPSDVDHFSRTQTLLPSDSKLRVSIARCKGELAAGLVVTSIGATGVYLLGATTDAGMRSKASYLLQWRALEWLHESGARFYNLHGINQMANPGVYHFKVGLCGRNGSERRYLGAYDCVAGSGGARLAQFVAAGRQLLSRTRHWPRDVVSMIGRNRE